MVKSWNNAASLAKTKKNILQKYAKEVRKEWQQ